MLNEISYSAASKHFKTGQYTQALTTLNKLIDTNRDARTYALLAKTCLRIGMPEQAATSYELAFQQGGMDAESYLVESIKLHYDGGQRTRRSRSPTSSFTNSTNTPRFATSSARSCWSGESPKLRVR